MKEVLDEVAAAVTQQQGIFERLPPGSVIIVPEVDNPQRANDFIAAVIFSMGRTGAWIWDMRAFRAGMIKAAAYCVRGALWADRVMADKAAERERIQKDEEAAGQAFLLKCGCVRQPDALRCAFTDMCLQHCPCHSQLPLPVSIEEALEGGQ